MRRREQNKQNQNVYLTLQLLTRAHRLVRTNEKNHTHREQTTHYALIEIDS